MGTLQAALAGNGIYGERDFMLWDSSMTEKDGKAQDVFLRQALLSGQRVPVLFGKSCVMKCFTLAILSLGLKLNILIFGRYGRRKRHDG